jgi:hypothetical protein
MQLGCIKKWSQRAQAGFIQPENHMQTRILYLEFDLQISRLKRAPPRACV